MRIADRLREAMLHMNKTYSPGEPGQWTVVGIAPGGGGGEGDRPLPAQAGPEARWNRAMIPHSPNRGGFHGKC
ncbi:protein of unknown function [Methanoculleus bourgensis]|uniref:Uncharacterized protein n=1 Tax=Methanoculleus bourgensis TaxID=83986 RepID=A0A0X3BNS9_9EURY|nr:protein of unknown function [Methanoculleus bourgensis]